MGKKLALPVACILLLASVAAAGVVVPTLLFRAQDHALLGAHEYPTATGTLALPLEEIAPVVATLYNIENTLDPAYTHLPVEDTAEADVLLSRMLGYSEALVAAGVLPAEFIAQAGDGTETTQEPFRYGHSVTSAGTEVIVFNSSLGVNAPYYLSYTIDMNTDLVVDIELGMPVDSATLAGRPRAMALAWLEYLGLAAAGDWQFFGGDEAAGMTVSDIATGGKVVARGISDSLRMECYVTWGVDMDLFSEKIVGEGEASFRLKSYRNRPDEWWNSYNILTATDEAITIESESG